MSLNRPYLLFLLLACFLNGFQTGACHAQDQDSTEVLSGSLVSGSRMSREIIPVQTLSGKELEQFSAHSVADALRYFSGLQIKDYGGTGGLKTVNVRSMGSQHVGVFYDGIEVGNAQNGVVDLSRFTLDNLEAVSLYNGQKSAIFQTAKDFASASAIYLRTRVPDFSDGKTFHLRLGMKAGSFLTFQPSLVWEQKITDRIASSLSASCLYSSGEYPCTYTRKDGYDPTAIRKNGDIRLLRTEWILTGKGAVSSWRAQTGFYHSERGYPGASVREEPGKFKHQDRQWDDQFFLQGTCRARAGDRYSFQVQAKYAWYGLRYLSDPRLDVTTLYVDNRFRQQEAYASLAHLIALLPGWSLSLANDVQWNRLDANLPDFVQPRRWQFLSSLATSLDLDAFKLQASLLHTSTSDHTLGQAARDRQVWTPSLILSVRPFTREDFHLRAFYKKAFRLPTLNDLYYTFIGNVQLEPETSRQFNAGFTYGYHSPDHWLQNIGFQLDGYFNQVRNKIIAMPTSNQFRWTMTNLGKVAIAGADAALQADLRWRGWQFSPRISYTWQSARDITDPDSPWYGGQIPYIPWHSGSFILNTTWKDWSAHYSFLYTGERYEAVANIPENHAQPWYTHDLALSRLFRFKKFKLKATAEINNLLNQQYEVVQCYPMPGIHFNLKVNFML